MEALRCLERDFEHIDADPQCWRDFWGKFSACVQELDWQYRLTFAPSVDKALLPMLISCQGQIVFINSSAG